jgi:hypothetical protein
MSPTYVLASCGTRVDMDVARQLLPGKLFHAAVVMAKRERAASPGWDANRTAQRVWDICCALYLEQFGTPFEPDANPAWDPPYFFWLESALDYIENPPDDPPPWTRVERVTEEDRRRFAEEASNFMNGIQ